MKGSTGRGGTGQSGTGSVSDLSIHTAAHSGKADASRADQHFALECSGRLRSPFRHTLLMFLLLCLPAFAQDHGHEYAPLHEKQFEFKDFTYKTLEGQSINLRELAAGKKLVLVHFFAAWCHNSNFDVTTVKALHEQFKDSGLAVIAVCEYSKPDEVREYLNKHQPAYPVVIESQKEKDRRKSSHFAYRTAAQDVRLWGTPFNVLLSVDAFSASGEVVTSKALVNFGELEKAEVEKIIKERLLPVSAK